MKHALLVAEDDFRGAYVDESLEAVVADDDATVEVVEVGGGEASAVEGYEGAEFGRDDGHDLDDHPFGAVASFGGTEGFDDLQTLEGFVFTLLRGVGHGVVPQVVGELVEVDPDEEVVDGFGADFGDEFVRVGVLQHLVVFGQAVEDVEVFLFGEEVHVLDVFGDAGLDDDVAFVVNDRVELLRRQAEQVADLVGQGSEVPNVCDGDDELYVPGAFAPHFLFGHLYAATVADDAFVTDAFIFSAIALIVFHRSEDALAEEPVAFGLVCAIVDRLGL